MDRKPIKLKNKIRNMSIEEVYQQFKNFIYKQCQSWLGKYEFDDLQQVAFIGLQKAYEGYEVDKDVQFLTYAAMAIGNELRIYHIKNKKHEDVFSLNKTFLFKDDEMEYIDTISDDINYEEIAFKNIQCENLRNALRKLKPIDREIVEEIGLNFKGQKEIAEKFNLSQSYISRKYKNLLVKLRKIMEGDDKMPEKKITREQLVKEVREHGTGKDATKLIAHKYGLSPGTIKSYYDTMDVRSESKNYKGKKTQNIDKNTTEPKQEIKVEVPSFLQEIKTYRGSIGQYQINDDNVDLQFGNTTVSIEKENIMNLVMELSELNRIIS